MLREYGRKSERKGESKRGKERDSSLNYSFSLDYYYYYSFLPPCPFLYSFRSARKMTARNAGAREMDEAEEAEKKEK